MPLTGSATVLQAAIKAKLLADSASKAVDNAALDALCKAVAEAVLEHIVINAAVVTPVGPGTIT